MKPVGKMGNKHAKSTSGSTRPSTQTVVTRGKKVKTYGQATRLKKKRSKGNPLSEAILGLRSRKAATPIPPPFVEPIPPPFVEPIPPPFVEPIPPPTLKRYDQESLVGAVVHTVPQPGPSFRPTEDYNNYDIILDQQQEEEEYESSYPVIANLGSLIPFFDLTTDDDDDEDKTGNEEKTNDLADDVKPEVVSTPASKKDTVRRRSRKPVKDISNDVVRKANELKSKNEFLLKVQREFVGLKNNPDLWSSIATEIPNCWIFLEALFDSKHATKK